MQNKPQPIPKVWQTYKFFDKGRMRISGIYDATVTQIMTIEESKKTYTRISRRVNNQSV